MVKNGFRKLVCSVTAAALATGLLPGAAFADAAETPSLSVPPVFQYAENSGGANTDAYQHVAFTKDGGFAVGGYTLGPCGSPSWDYTPSKTGINNAVILKYDSNHQLIEGGVAEGTSVALVYDPSNGSFASAGGDDSGQVAITFQGDAAAAGTVTFDFSGTTNYAPVNGATSSSLEASRGDAEGNNEGYPEGKMNGVAIGRDGTITRFYSNGQNRFAGRIVVAEFANVTGLNKEGENLYSATGNSGEANVMFVNEDGGYMSSGTLEMSNVDLAQEFTDMITTQRGFQANSRVITVTDTLLDELRQLKR